MNTLQFDTHLNDFYSLATIKTGYPLLKLMKIIDLKCHLICAVDDAVNLHFIQYREPQPSDPTIYPPSYALTDYPTILFSIDLLSIIKKTQKRHMNEEGFMNLLEELNNMWYTHIDVHAIRPGVLVLKPLPISYVYLIDLTMQNAEPKVISEFGRVGRLSAWSDNMIVFSSKTLKGIFAHSFELQKTKRLRFSTTPPAILKVIREHDLCIALFDKMLEILDLRRNQLIDRCLFGSFSENVIAVSPKGSKIAHSYLHGDILEGTAYLNLWNVDEQKNINRRDPVHLLNPPAHSNTIEFLNEEILICARYGNLNMYKIEEFGVVKVHTIKIPHNFGYIKPKHDGHTYWYHLDILVINSKNFLLMTTDVQEDAYNRIESYEVNPIKDMIDENPTNTSRRSIALIGSADKHSAYKSSLPKASQIGKIQLDIKTSLLFQEKVESIIAICTWKSEKIGVLYDTHKFYEYDLKSGKIERRVVLTRNGRSGSVKREIKYVDKDHIMIEFTKTIRPKPYAVVINLISQDIILDSKQLQEEYGLKNISHIMVLKEGTILLVYKKFGISNSFIGEVDLEALVLKDIMKIDMSQTPDDIWLIDQHLLAGRGAENIDTLLIWDLEKKALKLQKKFSPMPEVADEGDPFPSFWGVSKIDERTIALVAMDIVYKDIALAIYNWVEDRIIAACEVDVEDIVGLVNYELFIVLGEKDLENYGTYYATISMKNVLGHCKEEEVKELEFEPFANSFLGYDKDAFERLDNQKNGVLLIKQAFPQNVFIMRKRNRKLEMLRFVKRELENVYHPYLIQDAINIAAE